MSSGGHQNVPAEMKQRVVMFPFMAQGHIIPFLDLSKLIAARSGFTITIVNTPLNIQSLQPKIKSARQANPALDIRLAELPFSAPDHGLPPCCENTESLPPHLILTLLEASEHLQPHFERLIHQICQEDGRPPLSIISDMFLGWTLDVADMFGIPRILFCTCGCYGTLLYFSLWTHLPHTKTDADEFVLPDMPQVSLHRSQLAANFQQATGSDRWSLFQHRQVSRNMRSWGYICHTFEELEHDSLEHMRKSTGRPVWAVGPLLPSIFLSSSFQSCAANGSGLLLRGKESETDAVACLRWLDSHEPSSVLYVSFGTQNTISASNMKELALGLESSGQPFIWVVRPPLGVPLHSEFSPEFLPEGFEDRIKDKNQGLIVKKWAPQLLILSHSSTGGFLSHCGWNSTLESLSQGVPIIGWPLAGDQFFNSKLLEEKVGVCIELWRGKDGELTREKVERTVKTLMSEDRGRLLRKRAEEMRDAARKAVTAGEGLKGSSIHDIDETIAKLLACRAST
uniref:Glycosyltransferase n=1 Tax=Araucaria cunninghamii TaxID=56994 RepID=A0A0D6QV89_ARACU